MTRRQGNRPGRRVAAAESIPPEILQALEGRLRYAGIATHKLRPGDYGFVPPVNPRPSKSTCDALRPVVRAEAEALFRAGVIAGMVSPPGPDGIPKYVWSIDQFDEVYEAKTKPPDASYHGYRIGEDEAEMRRYIRDEWSKRCP